MFGCENGFFFSFGQRKMLLCKMAVCVKIKCKLHYDTTSIYIIWYYIFISLYSYWLASCKDTVRVQIMTAVSELIVPFANFTGLQMVEVTLNFVSFFCWILHGYWTAFSLSLSVSLSLSHIHTDKHTVSQHLGQCLGAVTCFCEPVWAGFEQSYTMVAVDHRTVYRTLATLITRVSS